MRGVLSVERFNWRLYFLLLSAFLKREGPFKTAAGGVEPQG